MTRAKLNVMQYMGTQGTLSGLDYHVLMVCEHLDRTRIRVMLTCPTENRNEDLQARLDKAGVPLYRFPSEGRDRLSYIKRTLALVRLLRRERVDVLHVHAGGFTGFNAFLAALFAGVRTIAVTHHSLFGLKPHSLSGRLSLLLEKRLASLVITPYSGQVNDLASVGIAPQHIHAVPNGVDLAKFSPAAGEQNSEFRIQNSEFGETIQNPKSKIQNHVFRLGIVARLIEEKGHEELLRAVHLLAGRYPQLRLLVVGDGPLRPRLEGLVAELGLQEIVEMVGQQPNDKVPDLLRTCQAVVLPTYMAGETFGMVLVEGMALGLPAIGTRHVAIPEIIADGETGLLVEPRNVQDLAAAIEKLVSNPELAAEMGRKGKARAEQRFSAQVLGTTLSELYVEEVARNQKSEIRNQKSEARGQMRTAQPEMQNSQLKAMPLSETKGQNSKLKTQNSKLKSSVMHYMAAPGLIEGVMGGLENHVLTVCEHVDRDKINPMITCPVVEGNDDLFRRTAAANVPLFPFPSHGRDRLSYAKRTLALVRLLRRERVDVLHVHAVGFSGLNAILAATAARVPTIIVTHHAWFGTRHDKWTTQLRVWVEKTLASRIILLYKAQAREMAAAGAPLDKLAVVPMGVDLSLFEPASENSEFRIQNSEFGGTIQNPKSKIQNQEFRLAIVSRVIEGKGHEEILRAMHRLIGRYPQLRLLIVGDGPNRPHIEALARELGLLDAVEFAGMVAHDDVPAYLRTAHVALLPTSIVGEAMPNTLVEGQAMGLAAIGTRFGGIPDIIAEGETGFLVTPKDVDDLTAAIEKLVSNPDLAAEMGRKGHIRARQIFSAEALGKTLTALYLRAGNPSPQPLSHKGRGAEDVATR